MGACATKPKVLKDGDEKPVSQPEPPPQKEKEEEEVVQREAENDAAVAPIESPAKNPSLGNLFIKESEDAKVSPGRESEKENAANSSKENEAIKAPDQVAREKNTEALEILPPAPVVEKEAIKAPEIIAKEALPAAPTTTTMADHVPVEEKEAAIKAPDEIIAKENNTPVALLDKFPEPSATTMADDAVVVVEEKDDANNKAAKNDATAIEKMDSQASEIVPEDFADALPAPASPVVNANANASENVGEKSIAGSLEKIPSPQPADTEEVYFPTNKIVSQFSEEYTDALPDDAPDAEKVAVVLDDNNTNALQSIKQSEEKEVEKSNPARDAKPLNTEDKKTVEEDAVEKQIEVPAESINPTQESDTVKQVKSVEILPQK